MAMPDAYSSSHPRNLGLLYSCVRDEDAISFENKEFTEAQWRICASPNYAIIDSDSGLSPVRRQPIIWINDGVSSIRPGRCRLQKCRPSCFGLNVLTQCCRISRLIPWFLKMIYWSTIFTIQGHICFNRCCADRFPILRSFATLISSHSNTLPVFLVVITPLAHLWCIYQLYWPAKPVLISHTQHITQSVWGQLDFLTRLDTLWSWIALD